MGDLSLYEDRTQGGPGVKFGAHPLLTPGAVEFLYCLHSRFSEQRAVLLERRDRVQLEIDAGRFPDFLPETQAIRDAQWKVASCPTDLIDRRVEITGPVDRKMVIHALNSGANVFMADLEDSHAPTWEGTLAGHQNLCDAVQGTIQIESKGRTLILNEKIATLFVRPRGWHMLEKHFTVGGSAISASLFDFGLYFFHNAKNLVSAGRAPYFYLPKLESHLEARLWNDIFVWAQNQLEIPQGTIRATVLIETILAAFEMDEILFELRDHSAGLNCGRWDYIFSFIKKFKNHPEFVMPDRSAVTMDVHFLKSYCQLLVQTCHRRGIHAMGGMAAQIPIKSDAQANATAMQRVRADKRREVGLGHDGTWVAHPGLVPIALEVFNEGVSGPNQIESKRPEVLITASDLLRVPQGEVTPAGIRSNIEVAIIYIESWLRGVGCLPIHHLMEDAATAEIARSQLWQWISAGRLSVVDFRKLRDEILSEQKVALGAEFAERRFDLAGQVLDDLCTAAQFVDFLTLKAERYLN